MASIIPVDVQPITLNLGPAAKLYRTPVGLDMVKSEMGPNSVRIDINWEDAPYSASTLKPVVAVAIDLLGSAVQTPLDKIRSVYIDNSNSITPIYIQFTDTDFVIQCPPRSVAWQPVLTGQQKAIIMGVGFVSNLIPKSRIHFTNIDVAGYVIPINGSNLVRGQFIGGNRVSIPANVSNSLPLLASAPAPDRIIAGYACNASGGATPLTVSAMTINGVVVPPAQRITINGPGVGGAGGTWQQTLFWQRVPLTSIATVAWTLNVVADDWAVAGWAIYNASDLNPIDYQTAVNANTLTPVNVAPFLTQDGYLIAAHSSRRSPTIDAVWSNVFPNGDFSNSELEFSAASQNGGEDNFWPLSVEPGPTVQAATWN